MPRHPSSRIKPITKQDLVDLATTIIAETNKSIAAIRVEMHARREDVRAEIRSLPNAWRAEIQAVSNDLRHELRDSIDSLRSELRFELRLIGARLEEARSMARVTADRHTNLLERIQRLLEEQRDASDRARLETLRAAARDSLRP